MDSAWRSCGLCGSCDHGHTSDHTSGSDCHGNDCAANRDLNERAYSHARADSDGNSTDGYI